MKKLALLLMLSLAACSTPAPHVAGPCIQYIECADGMADCKAQARNLCPKGYTNVDESTMGGGWAAFAREHFPGAATGVPHLAVTCAE